VLVNWSQLFGEFFKAPIQLLLVARFGPIIGIKASKDHILALTGFVINYGDF